MHALDTLLSLCTPFRGKLLMYYMACTKTQHDTQLGSFHQTGAETVPELGYRMAEAMRQQSSPRPCRRFCCTCGTGANSYRQAVVVLQVMQAFPESCYQVRVFGRREIQTVYI